MAKKQRAEQWAEQSEEQERRSRVMVITELDAVAPAAQVPAGTFCSSNP